MVSSKLVCKQLSIRPRGRAFYTLKRKGKWRPTQAKAKFSAKSFPNPLSLSPELVDFIKNNIGFALSSGKQFETLLRKHRQLLFSQIPQLCVQNYIWYFVFYIYIISHTCTLPCCKSCQISYYPDRSTWYRPCQTALATSNCEQFLIALYISLWHTLSPNFLVASFKTQTTKSFSQNRNLEPGHPFMYSLFYWPFQIHRMAIIACISFEQFKS